MEQVSIIIPARGGSKRLPFKNILPFLGRPLISWSVETAQHVDFRAQVIVTSDSSEILNTVKEEFGSSVILHRRPKHLATDDATTDDVLKDVISGLAVKNHCSNTIILLQPTCPLREVSDVNRAMNLYLDASAKHTLVSVVPLEHPSAWNGMLMEGNRLVFSSTNKIKRSQEYETEVRLNGSIYIFEADTLMITGSIYTKAVLGYEMPRIRSLDIDDQFDFEIAEYLKKKSLK